MRLCTFDAADGPEAAVLLGDELAPVRALGAPATDLRGLLEALAPDQLLELGGAASAGSERIALETVRLCAPVTDPEKIICIGLNYRDHAEESGQAPPPAPIWFPKFANSLRGSGDQILLPAIAPERVDYEAELAVVVGRRAHRISPDEALGVVAGAMPFNDVSARDLQMENQLWTRGKAIDGFAPCGPALVTLDEIPDIQALRLRTRIDGEVVQDGTTANQIFPVAEIVSFLSQTMTLVPGDVIATGTPAGVGMSKGRFLRAGELVEVEVEGLGAVANRVALEV